MFERFFPKKTLYFPGCLNKFFLREIANNYIKILRNLDISFVILKENELCCGSPALEAGYVNEFESIRDKNLELFNSNKIKKIITPDARCYETFLKNYDIEVEHITQVIARNLNKLPLKHEGKVTYHDSCYLSKVNLFDEPRKILDALGFDIVEFDNNKEKSECCGITGNLKQNLPTLSNKIALRLLDKCKTNNLVTSCPWCYIHLKENSTKINVYELSEAIL